MSRRTCDIAFPGVQLAVFIDGCFWHRCPEHYVAPKSNVEFWDDKTHRTSQRDEESRSHLEATGWQVLRFWEHCAPDAVAAEIASVVQSLRQ